MRGWLSLLLLTSAGCADAQGDPSPAVDEIMARIEASVTLPNGAGPLSAYARYYRFTANRLVAATYVRPWWGQAEQANTTCEEYPSGRTIPCQPGPDMSSEPRAGERRWVRSDRDVPQLSDGGCDVIQFTYDPLTGRMTQPHCNGLA